MELEKPVVKQLNTCTSSLQS